MKIMIYYWTAVSPLCCQEWICLLKNLNEETPVPVLLPLDSHAKNFTSTQREIFNRPPVRQSLDLVLTLVHLRYHLHLPRYSTMMLFLRLLRWLHRHLQLKLRWRLIRLTFSLQVKCPLKSLRIDRFRTISVLRSTNLLHSLNYEATRRVVKIAAFSLIGIETAHG